MGNPRSTRLKEIISRQGPESDETRLARIRGIVEQGSHVCPRCGFPAFTGHPHAHAGIRGQTKSQTRICTGQITIEPKDAPQSYEWACPDCHQHWMYTQAEIEVADTDDRCHECAAKYTKET